MNLFDTEPGSREGEFLYMVGKIESMMELPYRLIDINTGNEHFIFQFDEFDDDQTGFSIKMGGVTGSFSIVYKCRGIESCFGCDITIGNVHDFYTSLSNAYNIMFGKETVTVLKNYGDMVNRTNLTIKFDNKGHCYFEGCFSNKYTQYKSGINLSFEVDQSYISEILKSMDKFFYELRRIQGHCAFY